MDFQFDATADGRRLMFLSLIDECSPLGLAIRVCTHEMDWVSGDTHLVLVKSTLVVIASLF